MPLKHRLIPVLLLKDGHLVRSEGFREHQVIGNPIHEVRRFSEWHVDEVIYLDITREGGAYDLGRDDHRVASASAPMDILSEVAKHCFMPLTFGGGLRSLDDMHGCFARGADKIAINSAALHRPELIDEAAARFGSQAIVVSIDVRRTPEGTYEVYGDRGRSPTGRDGPGWAREAADRGAGEVLLQSIDRDGRATGYDTDAIGAHANAVSVPLVACSGVGTPEHYAAGIEAGASAVAAANIWHFTELTDRKGKRALAQAGIPVRQPASSPSTRRSRRRARTATDRRTRP